MLCEAAVRGTGASDARRTSRPSTSSRVRRMTMCCCRWSVPAPSATCATCAALLWRFRARVSGSTSSAVPRFVAPRPPSSAVGRPVSRVGGSCPANAARARRRRRRRTPPPPRLCTAVSPLRRARAGHGAAAGAADGALPVRRRVVCAAAAPPRRRRRCSSVPCLGRCGRGGRSMRCRRDRNVAARARAGGSYDRRCCANPSGDRCVTTTTATTTTGGSSSSSRDRCGIQRRRPGAG